MLSELTAFGTHCFCSESAFESIACCNSQLESRICYQHE